MQDHVGLSHIRQLDALYKHMLVAGLSCGSMLVVGCSVAKPVQFRPPQLQYHSARTLARFHDSQYRCVLSDGPVAALFRRCVAAIPVVVLPDQFGSAAIARSPLREASQDVVLQHNRGQAISSWWYRLQHIVSSSIAVISWHFIISGRRHISSAVPTA